MCASGEPPLPPLTDEGMDRRSFVAMSGLALGATALPRESRPATPRAGRRSAEVIVVGGGAFGGWTALHVQRAGTPCLLVDAYGPGNPRATSGGGLRQIRAGYGEREVYTRWAVEALERWRSWEKTWGEELLVPTGRLTLAAELTDSIRATMAVLDRVGVEHELLTVDELTYRYPQISPEGLEIAHWEPTAAAIRAAQACRVVARAFVAAGGELAIARAQPGGSAGDRLEWIALADGTIADAQAFVFACGPWLPRMFPELLGARIDTPRRDVFYFGTPAGDARFSHPALPNFSEPGAAFYGFPSIDYRGLKVAPVGGNVRFDPDVDERIVVGYQVKRSGEYLARRFPALAGQPVIESRVCQLEDTPDAHFIIDRHPGFQNVWLAGGGSGHAFKHGPVLGEYVARRVLGESTDPALDDLFALR